MHAGTDNTRAGLPWGDRPFVLLPGQRGRSATRPVSPFPLAPHGIGLGVRERDRWPREDDLHGRTESPHDEGAVI